LQQERERLIELIRTLPDDKIKTILDFVNRMLNEYTVQGDDEDELLME